MASGPGVSKGQAVLDMLLAGGATVRLWSTAPDYDGDPAGVEVVPAGGAPTVTFSPAVAGTAGQIVKAVSNSAALFTDVPVANTGVVALSLHDPADDSMIAINNAWASPVPWSAGGSPLIPAGGLVVPFVPVS